MTTESSRYFSGKLCPAADEQLITSDIVVSGLGWEKFKHGREWDEE